ncbi:APC family permease [Sulfobacillus thermosulfidooxidans]|uniref:APC family permease n=1 Tax=Sulfobacillus thermosulfidooxidans TaxID=28034 RepID=UPI00096B7FE2|nr:APC family permease [Sulfobacillus thermosulfidooxidans]OLZ11595.1 aspartate:proton symporter [Sulfobacillus thermosulfidooxidans]OLZ17437.1 aspartate:proton symporter [Sulfobacillus thermosulfidooxidans]OLZ21053.1 aspartate:proton symporter [Sulfobacillus thermosulfidooxidans]
MTLQTHLKKELSLLDLTMASLGAIIGSGWLLASQSAAEGAGPSAVLSWLIAGIVVMLLGLVYAELGSFLPEAGAIVRYPQYSHGPLASFIIGWAAFVAYSALPAVESEAVVTYAQSYIPAFKGAHGTISLLGLMTAAGLMIVFYTINYFGVRTFARVNTPLTLLKFFMPSLTIVLFFIFGFHARNFHVDGFMPGGSAGMMKVVSTAGVVFSYLGFRQAVDLSGEAKNPGRDVPLAVVLSLIIGIALYTLLQVVFIGAVPSSVLAHGWQSLSYSAPFAQLALTLNLAWFGVLIFADAIISPLGTGNVYMATTPRVLYALAQNRHVPKIFRKVDPLTGVPVSALTAGLIVGIIFLAPFPAWQALVAVASSAAVLTYITGPVSAAVFRRTAIHHARPVRLGALGLIAPLAFIGGSLIIYWTGWNTNAPLLGIILAGLILYLLAGFTAPQEIARPDKQSVKSAAWLIVFLLFMLVMSYVGSGIFGSPANHGKGIIPYPWDLVVVALFSLAFYYWGVQSGYRTRDLTERLEESLTAGKEDHASSVADLHHHRRQ